MQMRNISRPRDHVGRVQGRCHDEGTDDQRKALRYQAAADAECTQIVLDRSGNQDISLDMLNDGAHRRALAQRVKQSALRR